ncbi:MAG TPA: subclass B3 metallo-beta-lactamase [Pyrinomonadaceae bacterium]
MIPIIKQLSVTVYCCLLFSISGIGQSNDDIKLGIAPVEPFRIVGNIYYVGSSDLTSYLIVTSKGNILIDGGMKEMVPQVVANISKLGFRLEDTKIILNSHAHFDHAGGIAELRRLTKAKFLASELDAPLLRRGGVDDPNFDNRFPFEPTIPDETFVSGRKVKLGGTELIANVTSGHTKGCTTWTTVANEAGKKLNVIFVCSVSSPGYKLVGNDKYADIENDYLRSFRWFKNAKVDVFLASHAGFFDLESKRKQVGTGKVNPFVDSRGYREFIESNEETFVEKLRSQKSGSK